VGRPRNSSETGGPVGDASANRVRPRQRLSVARAALSDTASALRDPDAPNPRCMASGPRQSARHRTARATGKSLQRALASDGHDMAGGVTPRVCSAGLAAVLWACLAARTYMPTRPLLRFESDHEPTHRRKPVWRQQPTTRAAPRTFRERQRAHAWAKPCFVWPPGPTRSRSRSYVSRAITTARMDRARVWPRRLT
jgi:hypothetical protein